MFKPTTSVLKNVSRGQLFILSKIAEGEPAEVLKELSSRMSGLKPNEVHERRRCYGRNEISGGQRVGIVSKIVKSLRNTSSLLLLVLATLSFIAGDSKAAAVIFFMLFLSSFLRCYQEAKADRAAAKLKSLVRAMATVVRGDKELQVSFESLVPGDIVKLSAGDMVPADLRLLESKDLFVNQAVLTGESMPAEKHAPAITWAGVNDTEIPNICFLGTSVASGLALAVVVATGSASYLGSLSRQLATPREATNFERSIGHVAILMIKIILVLAPIIFVINGWSKGDWFEAFMFALAVAVGLAPELLPMITAVNLSKGAVDLARRKVIVKYLPAIQNFGAMDVLCTDKTGTLTEGKVSLMKYLNIRGESSDRVLNYAYLNSHFQTGLRNLLDVAVLEYPEARTVQLKRGFSKVDEIPFDFNRRRMTVVLQHEAKGHLLVTKGAIEEVLSCVTRIHDGHREVAFSVAHRRQVEQLAAELEKDGFRVLGVAVRELSNERQVYSAKDETGLTFWGFLAFLDPPRKTVALALEELRKYGVAVKILTGDNEPVTRKICDEVGIKVGRVLSGAEVDKLDDVALSRAAEGATFLSKLEPRHKERVVRALRQAGHVVGFLGDGINDALALRAADLGISVDSAVDVARESSDLILLDKNLVVLKDGLIEGRRIFGNVVKYVKMATSSNFGNMLSVVGGSVFLPFLPMLPLQIVTNNLLYDFSQMTIPTDGIDAEELKRPWRWDNRKLLRFILFFGPISSLFDFSTFLALWFLFGGAINPAIFHSGWFIESLMTQVFIVHVIRTRKVPFFQSRASWPLIISSALVVLLGTWLPFSPLATAFGFVTLPTTYWFYLAGFIMVYFGLTQVVKTLFIRRYGWN